MSVQTYITKCLELSERATLKEKIGIAIGEASMCWDPLPSGVFDSTDAIRISKELESDVFAVIDRLPKVCEALKVCIDTLKALPCACESNKGYDRICNAFSELEKIFDDADGG